jgi:hypothetical protein
LAFQAKRVGERRPISNWRFEIYKTAEAVGKAGVRRVVTSMNRGVSWKTSMLLIRREPMSLLTELGTVARAGYYKYVAPTALALPSGEN